MNENVQYIMNNKMMNGVQGLELSEVRRTPSSSHSVGDKSKITALSNPIKSFNKFELIIAKNQLESELQIIKWRSGTELPISKVLFYKVVDKKRNFESHVVQIGVEDYVSSLHLMPNIPLFQVLYLGKESFIGFERLFDRFGGFDINGKMILITKTGKCKVWCHSDICQNRPQNGKEMSELSFKNQLVRLLEEKCLKSVLTKQLFECLLQQQTLADAINYIKSFCTAKRIIASNNLPSLQHSLRPRNSAAQQSFCNRSYRETSKKIPQFIETIRKARKNSDSSCVSSQLSKHSYSGFGLSRQNTNKSNKSDQPLLKTNKSEQCFRYQMPIRKKISRKGTLEGKQKNDEKANQQDEGGIRRRLKSQDIVIKVSSPISDFITTPTSVEFTPKQEDSFNFGQVQIKKQDMFFNYGYCNEKLLDRKLSQQDLPSINNRRVVDEEKVKTSKVIGLKPNPNYLEPPKTRKQSIRETIDNSPHLRVLMRYADQKQEDILDKNGWLKRVGSLTGGNFRDTVFSQSDGNEEMAEHMLMNSIKLQLLDKLGTQLKGSILMNNE